MIYRAFVIVVFTFLSFITFRSLAMRSEPKDSLLKYNLEALDKKIEKKSIKHDSILRDNNYRLNIKVDYLEKNLNTRVDDFYKMAPWYTGIVIFVAGVIGALTFWKGKSTAKETAQDEFEKRFKVYQRKIKKLELEANTIIESMKAYEASAKGFSETIETMVQEADGKKKDFLDDVINKISEKLKN